ncbi:MAG: hypothetical protein ACRD9S_19255 [Pyrinomonadaceae bacterium]
MSDDAGNTLQLHEAKDLISARLNQKPTFQYEVSKDEEKLLVRLSQQTSATVEDLNRILGLHHERAADILDRLEKNRYIVVRRSFLGFGAPDKYELDGRGREFLMSKNLI